MPMISKAIPVPDRLHVVEILPASARGISWETAVVASFWVSLTLGPSRENSAICWNRNGCRIAMCRLVGSRPAAAPRPSAPRPVFRGRVSRVSTDDAAHRMSDQHRRGRQGRGRLGQVGDVSVSRQVCRCSMALAETAAAQADGACLVTMPSESRAGNFHRRLGHP